MILATLALGACGGDDDEDDGGGAATTATAQAETTPTEEAPPSDGELTEAGSKLDFGEAAVVDYSPSGAGGDEVKVAVTPLEVEEGDPDDLEGIDISDAPDDAVPHYLKVRVENVDEEEIAGGNPARFLDAYDNQGEEQSEITFLLGEFEPCPDDAPDPIEAGSDFETCLTYLLPPGESIERLEWIILSGSGGDPIVWEG
jgi:hypothetical protein